MAKVMGDPFLLRREEQKADNRQLQGKSQDPVPKQPKRTFRDPHFVKILNE